MTKVSREGFIPVMLAAQSPSSDPGLLPMFRAKTHRLEQTQHITASRSEVFAFFSDAFNLEKITPPFLRFQILTPAPIDLRSGTLIEYSIRLFGIPMGWRTRIERFEPNKAFVDTQVRGPYALWHHTHTFEEDGEGTLMRDVVRYRLPLGALGRLVAGRWVDGDLDRVFSYRFTRMEELMAPEPTRRQAAG